MCIASRSKETFVICIFWGRILQTLKWLNMGCVCISMGDVDSPSVFVFYTLIQFTPKYQSDWVVETMLSTINGVP